MFKIFFSFFILSATSLFADVHKKFHSFNFDRVEDVFHTYRTKKLDLEDIPAYGFTFWVLGECAIKLEKDDDALAYFQIAMNSFIISNCHEGMGWASLGKAKYYFCRENFSDAKRWLKAAKNLFAALNDQDGLTKCEVAQKVIDDAENARG